MRGRVFRILLAGTFGGALVLALTVLILFPEMNTLGLVLWFVFWWTLVFLVYLYLRKSLK